MQRAVSVQEPRILVCGQSPFVEHVTDQSLAAGHAGSAITTERFGPAREMG